MGAAYGAAPKQRHVNSWVVRGNMKVGNVVTGIGRAFDCCLIDAVLNYHCGKRSSGNQRLSNDDVAPCCRQAIRSDADLNTMRVHWAVVTAAHIVLTRPNELDRRATQTFRNHSRFALHM